MILVRNSRYSGPHAPYLDRVVLRFCQSCPPAGNPRPGGFAGLRQRDVDMAFTRDPTIISGLRSIPGVKVLDIPAKTPWLPPPCALGAGGHPALRGTQGKLVRRALAYGIDREAMARTILGGLRPDLPGERQRRPLEHASLLRSELGASTAIAPPLPAASSSKRVARRGADRIYVCAGERLSLRLRGDLQRALARAYCRADTALPAAGRCRGRAELRSLFRQRWASSSKRAVRSIGSSYRLVPPPMGSEPTSMAAASAGELHGVLPAARHGPT